MLCGLKSFDNWVRLVGGRDVWIDPRLGTEPMPKVIDKRLVTETDLRRGAVVLCQRPGNVQQIVSAKKLKVPRPYLKQPLCKTLLNCGTCAGLHVYRLATIDRR